MVENVRSAFTERLPVKTKKEYDRCDFYTLAESLQEGLYINHGGNHGSGTEPLVGPKIVPYFRN